MFGLQWADTARLPLAVREAWTYIRDGIESSTVGSSYASLGVRRDDGAHLTIRRDIVGGDKTRVHVTEIDPNGKTIPRATCRFGQRSIKDETGGFQHFLFEGVGLPRLPVMTRNGSEQEVYLENLAPLFFIDQAEGWNDSQSMQVHRYGLWTSARSQSNICSGPRLVWQKASARARSLASRSPEGPRRRLKRRHRAVVRRPGLAGQMVCMGRYR